MWIYPNRKRVGLSGWSVVAAIDDLNRVMGPTLTSVGFQLDEVDDAVTYGERPAWAVYYRGSDSKLPVSARGRDRLHAGPTRCAERVWALERVRDGALCWRSVMSMTDWRRRLWMHGPIFDGHGAKRCSTHTSWPLTKHYCRGTKWVTKESSTTSNRLLSFIR